jgi:hypothetical protein
MRCARVFVLLLLPACGWFGVSSLSWQRAMAEHTTGQSRFSGVYLSHTRGPSMNVSLGPDGSATVTEDPGNGARTLFGHWVDSSGQVTVTFDAMQGAPAEPAMVFQPAHDGLQAVTWNHASWGKVAPPPMKKGSKVKELYWFTTNP